MHQDDLSGRGKTVTGHAEEVHAVRNEMASAIRGPPGYLVHARGNVLVNKRRHKGPRDVEDLYDQSRWFSHHDRKRDNADRWARRCLTDRKTGMSTRA